MKDKVIACKGVRVFVLPPPPVEENFPDEDRSWTLLIDQGGKSTNDVVVGWFRTREDARKQARILRKAIKIKNPTKVSKRCGS